MGCSTRVSVTDPLLGESRSSQLIVPFFADNSDQCGPAALASVLVYWGSIAPPEALRGEIYLRSIRGSLGLDLLMAAEKRGYEAISYRGSIPKVIEEIDAGHPMIALLNTGSWIFSKGHFVVITGYDSDRGGIYVHSGATSDQFVSFDAFLDAWKNTGFWTLRIVPNGAGAAI